MRTLSIVFLLTAFVVRVWAQKAPASFICVEGGVFKNSKSNYAGKSVIPSQPYLSRNVSVPAFYIGKYEVTQKEWTEIMGTNPSKFRGENLPVDSVSWYECVEYCNKRSEAEGLKAYYIIDKLKSDPENQNEIDDIKWTVTIDLQADGYRLPTEMEWEYAATGGQKSRNYTYSGSDDVDRVAWYYKNSGDVELTGFWSWPAIQNNHNRTQPVGRKEPNELGIYDMSGNAREWCWNAYADVPSQGVESKASSSGRVWRGGGWLGGDFCCASTYRAGFEASGKGADQGFRLCRNKNDSAETMQKDAH